MVTPKKTAKKNKPVIDLTMAEDATDVFAAYGRMKVNQNMPLTDLELDAIITNHVDAVIASMFTWNNTVMLDDNGKFVALNLSVYEPNDIPADEPAPNAEYKKPGFLKRVWNWLRGKK